MLVRDVTDLRRRDRELVTKDATIREIHHRVKNNLQTVAALLRLQARRMDSADAKAALEEAVRRVGSIALVHETLSQTVEENVDFDEVADRLGTMVTDVGSSDDVVGARVRREGSFGVMSSEAATALAMVLTELVQNAVRARCSRGLTEIVVGARRDGHVLRVRVDDDGAGLPDGLRPGRVEQPRADDRGHTRRVRAGRRAHAGSRATRARHPRRDRRAARLRPLSGADPLLGRCGA